MRMTVAGAFIADTHGMSSRLSPLVWHKQRVFCGFFCICKCPSASQWQLKLRSFSFWEYQPMLRYSRHTEALTSSHNGMDYLSPCFFFSRDSPLFLAIAGCPGPCCCSCQDKKIQYSFNWNEIPKSTQRQPYTVRYQSWFTQNQTGVTENQNPS